MNRQKQILVALLVVLALLGVRAYLATPRQQKVVTDDPGRNRDAGQLERLTRSGSVDDQQVKLDLLEPAKEKYQGYKRDVFNFYVPKPKPKPVEKVVTAPPKKVILPPPREVVTPQVRQQLAKFTFLGFLVKDQERTVFLAKRDDLFLVKRDDTFGENNQFKVVSVTEEMMKIRQNDTDGLIEIVLVEKEPLIPSFSSGGVTSRPSGGFVTRPSALPNAQPSAVPLQEQRKPWFKQAQQPPEE
ncbi:MAG: hypothetical protein C0623_03760 [Desulfuromonas sp.]|nr:MAG: hypothetical protein C0623_03760 [Desulfuromonas sp.]